MNFKDFAFDERIERAITELGYETPTPIQIQAIPPCLEGKNIIGLAQTGTGKTAAFALPIIQKLLSLPPGPIRALVLAPTRELAVQIEESIYQYSKNTDLYSICVFGGVSMNNQIDAIRKRPDIVVGCPGRILDHLQQKTIDLSKIDILVLDEADQMLDMGFIPTIRRILKFLPQNRQTLLFSATMPQEIRGLAGETCREAVTIQVDRIRPAATVSHGIYSIEQDAKTQLLLAILKRTEFDSVLVFTRTKHRAKRLALQLEKSGYKVAALQGNLSQNRRQEAMQGFRDGKYQIMVATDIAARGIDVESVSHVINYDVPNTPEAYTHRIGRTGRASRTGDAMTFVSREDQRMLQAIERFMGKSIERRVLEGFKAEPSLEKLELPRPSHHRPQHHRGGGGGHHRGGGHRGGGGGGGGRPGGNGGGGRHRQQGPALKPTGS